MSRVRDWSLSLSALAVSVLVANPAIAFSQTKPDQRQVVLTPSSSESLGQSPGAYYALVIGIADYQYLPRLKTPVNDANDVEKVLRESYGFKTQLLPNATRDQVIGALDHDQRTLGPNDSLLIYYAGHGFYDKLEDQGYWAPVDAGQDTYAHWITATDITIRTKAIPARHVLVISDSCYSGKLTRSVDPSVVPVDERGPYIARMLEGKSRHLMASGGNEPVPDTDPEHPNHSIFANALILGLQQMPVENFSASELFDQRVRVQVSGRSPQMPEYNYIRDSGHDGGDFVFSRTGGGVERASAIDVILTPRNPPPTNPDKDAVRAALNLYESAYDSMDTDLLKKIWPSLSREQIRELRAGFDGAKAVMVELRSPAITLAGDTATVTADQWMKWTRAGHQQPPQANSVQIQLKKDAGGSWLVDGVRGH
jgi:uncharacterized caspase-like protein